MRVDKIHYTSRLSVKLGDSYATFEFGEDRFLDEGDDVEAEIAALKEACDAEVDKSVIEIKNSLQR